jgi:hypothetical protein
MGVNNSQEFKPVLFKIEQRAHLFYRLHAEAVWQVQRVCDGYKFMDDIPIACQETTCFFREANRYMFFYLINEHR